MTASELDFGAACREITDLVARDYPGASPSQFRVVLEWEDGAWCAFVRTRSSNTRIYPVGHPTAQGALDRLRDYYRKRLR
jgi:hypothetical protein